VQRWLSGQSDLNPAPRVEPPVLRIDSDDRITLGRFASLIGKARNTVAQYRDQPGFPSADEEGSYRAGDLLDYWNSRPGRRGPARKPRG